MSEKILNRIEFFNELRDVIRGEKPPSLASGLVNISDVLDFIFDLGLEDATLFAFDEDEDGRRKDEDDEEVSSLEVSDTE